MIMALAAAQTSAAPPVHRGSRTFISPMGEPFRTQSGGKAPEEIWFERADADHDGKITLGEFMADAGRFFRTLDLNRDGRIGPTEIQHYEDDIAPETQGGIGDVPADRGGGGGHRGGSSRRHGGVARSTQTAADEDNITSTYLTPPQGYDAGDMGAARFSYLDLPEPVAAADINFDRSISPSEYVAAARQRFDALDANRDGALTRDELPHLGGGHSDHRAWGKGGGPHPHRGGEDRGQ
jgi:Ca2+-binding EF-hand superfamily protein